MNKLELLLEKARKSKACATAPQHEDVCVAKPLAKPAASPVSSAAPSMPTLYPQSLPEPVASFQTRYITSPEEARDMAQTAFAADQIIGFDIETARLPQFANHPKAGLSAHLSSIRLVQLCQDLETVYVVDVARTGLDSIRQVFTKPLVAHNAVFEMSHLYHAGIKTPHIDCTMLMYNTLHSVSISLKDLALKELGMIISKEDQKSDWGRPELSPAQISYAARDAWLPQKLGTVLMEKINEKEKGQVYQLLRDAQYPVMKMEYKGCHFDSVAHWHLMEKIKKQWKAAEARLKESVGPSVNLNSNKQLSDHFKQVLGKNALKSWKRTETGDGLCLDKYTVAKFNHIQAVAPLSDYRNLSTKIQSFGDTLVGHISPATGRIHPNFAIAGTVTGRFSCTSPNLQQIPKQNEYRSLFSAPTGRKIVVADYSQIELRILAMLANEPVMLDAYRNGGDLHRLTASSMAGVPPEDVTAEQRNSAKPVNFGIIYGMGAKGLSEYARNGYGVSMTIKQASESINAFLRKYPAVKRWGERSSRDASIYRQVQTRMGRVIKVNNPYTESRNYPVQGSAGEVMLAALIELEKEIDASGLDIQLVNTIHDEIVLEVDAEVAPQAKTLLEKAMINGMLRIFPEAYTHGLVEAGIGDNWGEAK